MISRPVCFSLVVLCTVLLSSCGDSRPAANGLAHIYNSSDQPVSVVLKSTGGSTDGYSVNLDPGEGRYASMSKADLYEVTVSSPPALASYRESAVLSEGDDSEYLFDIGASGRFIIEPTFHVATDMTDMEAQSAVASARKEYPVYNISIPAARHKLQTGAYYSFGDNMSDYSQSNTDARVEVRYQLRAVDG